MPADRPPRFIGFVALLIVLWIVAYWATPAPRRDGPEIDFQAPPGVQAGATDDDPIESSPGAVVADDPVEIEADPLDAGGAPPPTSPAGAVVPPSFQIYYSLDGDTFQSIAREFYGTTARWRVISNANPLADPNRLGPGTRLLIPLDPENVQGRPAGDLAEDAAAPDIPPDTEFTEYIISRGDTLSGIAKALYGRASLWPRIAQANPGVNPDRLRPGTTLRIPPPPAPE
jgi:nucleoid-associated protein YgaU